MAGSIPQERLIALAGAQERFGRGDLDAALALLDAIPLDSPIARPVIERRLEYRHLFGRLREALADLRDAAHPAPAEIHARVADMCLAHGDPALAAVHLDRAIALEPRSARLHMARADAQARLGAHEDAARSLGDAVRASRDAAMYLGAASRIALDAGAFDAARDFAERLLAIDASAPAAHHVLARLALFVGDAACARRHADALMDTDPMDAHTIAGAAHATGGDDRAALAALDRALAIDRGAWEARTWRAEILLREGAFAEAIRDAEAAIERAPGLHVSARIIRVLATMGPHMRGGASLFQGALEEIESALCAIVPDAGPILDAAEGRAVARVLSDALRAMRGNRTLSPSFVRGETLVPLRAHPGPRFASRLLLERVATADHDALLAAFDPLIARFPRSGLPLCHRGELRLWLGDYAGARVDLEATIAAHPRTRWAYIGLGTLETIEGRFERALEILALGVARMDDTTGPAVYGARGEALRRLGRIDDAIADLETACNVSPRRVSAQMNLALAYAAKGRRDDAARVFDRIADGALALLDDAAAEIGSRDPVPLLERALALMLGNRSSACVTWRSRGSALRCIRITSGSRRAIEELRVRELRSATATRTRARAPS